MKTTSKYIIKLGRYYIKKFEIDKIIIDHYYPNVGINGNIPETAFFDKKIASKVKEYIINNNLDVYLDGQTYDENHKPLKYNSYYNRLTIKSIIVQERQ